MTNEQETDNQYRIVMILEELLKWIKVTSIPFVKKLIFDSLPTNDDKIAYTLSDGIRTSRDVAGYVSLGYVAVASRWNSWIKLGIAEAIPVQGGGARARRLFSLDDFGFSVPISETKSSIVETKQVEVKSDE